MNVLTEDINMRSKLSFGRLKRIVIEEKKKMQKKGIIPVDSVETVDDAWAGGENLVNQIDFIKKLGIKETKLREAADQIARARVLIKKKIVKDL
jgi:hypothetical protein|tara:strand:+ start:750 stop:1031 length:282 start_codon:yes stop_codon:yes gene_type:complete